MIKGLWADDAAKLLPHQWVNVYEISGILGANFYCSLQVQELNKFINEFGAADWFLELTGGKAPILTKMGHLP
jgi:hypothetical protein